MKRRHAYEVSVGWTGNDGTGTRSYRGYRRDHVIAVADRPIIAASSDPAFRGNPSRYNPEELLVAALSGCHMLSYLHLCAVSGISVVEYHDAARGLMEERDDGAGAFVCVTLRPRVTIEAGGDRDKALALHGDAHHVCFIARSVNFPVEVEPEITLLRLQVSGNSSGS